MVVVLGLVEGERVLESGATAAADGDAKRLGVVLLTTKELADLAGGYVGKGDRLIRRVSHFTKCSGPTAEARPAAVWQNRSP
jgi:hypothetical protein